MTSREDYRGYAAECLKPVAATNDARVRATLAHMAQVWLRLAGEKEIVGCEDTRTCAKTTTFPRLARSAADPPSSIHTPLPAALDDLVPSPYGLGSIHKAIYCSARVFL